MAYILGECCCDSGPCDLCGTVADIVAACDPVEFCDYCGDLCGTVEVTGGFIGPCTAGLYEITLVPGLIEGGKCGWVGSVTHDSCTIYFGITPGVDAFGSPACDYAITGYLSDYSAPLGSAHSTTLYTCEPLHLQFDILTDTLNYCGSACTYQVILDECAPLLMAAMPGSATRKRPRNAFAFPACANPDDELPAGEVASLKLDTRKRWYRCTTGEHPAHCRCQKGVSRARDTR